MKHYYADESEVLFGMGVTMKEIAERAGVHPSTVDKVVHHRVGVSDEVRARVQAIINELGYTPNPSGRVLQRQGKVYRISAILVQVDALPYLKKGIERGVKEQTGFDIEVSYAVTGFQEAKRQSEYIIKAVEEKADGIIHRTVADFLLLAEAAAPSAPAGSETRG